jgi:Rieske Fe-S protein
MGCIVQWNTAQRSWDCPCHGARYAPTGEVLEGPALTGLAREEAADVPAVSRKSGS